MGKKYITCWCKKLLS